MLCVCVVDVMEVVFSVCIVRRGAVGAIVDNSTRTIIRPLTHHYHTT